MRTFVLASLVLFASACGTPGTQKVPPPLSTLSTELPPPTLAGTASRAGGNDLDPAIDPEPEFGADCRGGVLDRGTLAVLTPARRRTSRCVSGGELLDFTTLPSACAVRFHLQCSFPQCAAKQALAGSNHADRVEPLELRWQVLDVDHNVMWESSAIACDSLDQRPAPRTAWAQLPLMPGAAYVRTVGASCSPCAPHAVLHFEISN